MPNSVSEVFEQMIGKFNPGDWNPDEKTVLQFNISGDGGGNWTAIIEGGKLSVTEGTADDAAMAMSCTAEDLIAMVNGELNAVSAFMQGKIKIDGNMSLAMKLQSLIT